MKNSAKKSVTIKLSATEQSGLRYFTIYEVKGVMDNDERTVIDRFTDKAKAEGCKKLHYDCNLYRSVYIIEQIVLVD